MMESAWEELTRGDKEIEQRNFYWLYTYNYNKDLSHEDSKKNLNFS